MSHSTRQAHQPKLPTLDMKDANQIGDLKQADRRGDDHRRQCSGGQVFKQVRCGHQEEGDAERTNYSCQLRSGASSLRHGCARRTAANGKALKKAGSQVGGTESYHFLIWVDAGFRSCGVSSGEDARVSEGYKGNGQASN